VRWDVYLLMLRALAMFVMAAHGLAFILVPLMALLLSYFEVWPGRALGAVFGDPIAAARIRSGRSCVELTPALTATAAARRTKRFPTSSF
jgi:hypothetical protein